MTHGQAKCKVAYPGKESWARNLYHGALKVTNVDNEEPRVNQTVVLEIKYKEISWKRYCNFISNSTVFRHVQP